ncbi:MAG: hypothetical protein RQ833_09330 [Sphingomonadaceae bacterium]|nr:hypothetical protein [Sphingomonadaceae bacterium]
MSGARVALPGVTFRTSRWRDALAMLAGLNFPAAGSGRAAGDLAVDAEKAAAIPAGAGDAAFEDAMRQLGLDGWPVAAEPRVSLLWTGSAPWALVGVLIESPEPIERAGRTKDAKLAAVLPGQSIDFTVRVADRTASRLLFLLPHPLTVPVQPAAPKPPWFSPSFSLRPVPSPGRIGGVRGPALSAALSPGAAAGMAATSAVPAGAGVASGQLGSIIAGPIGGFPSGSINPSVSIPGPIGPKPSLPQWQPPRLRLTLVDIPLSDVISAPSLTLTGLMDLPPRPAFAAEAF